MPRSAAAQPDVLAKLPIRCATAIARRVRAPLAGLLLVVTGLGWAGPAAGAVCPPGTGSYRVDVRTELPPVVIHHDLSRAQLGLLAFHGPTNRVLGITASNLRAARVTRYGHRPLEGEGNCFWVNGIEVTLRYEALDIYIASEYPPGSCQYQAILNHENKHAAAAQALLDDYVEEIRSVLTSLAIPKPRAPRLVETVSEAQQQTQAAIENLLLPVLARLRKTMQDVQSRIDARAEYRRVEKQCAKW